MRLGRLPHLRVSGLCLDRKVWPSKSHDGLRGSLLDLLDLLDLYCDRIGLVGEGRRLLHVGLSGCRVLRVLRRRLIQLSALAS